MPALQRYKLGEERVPESSHRKASASNQQRLAGILMRGTAINAVWSLANVMSVSVVRPYFRPYHLSLLTQSS